MRPALSVRDGAATTMAGAIFMSNTVTRDQCFQAGVFGLPIQYQSFVCGVRKGMPLFLFDHNLCKLYGVFEAASDGGLNINRDAFQRAYPAQVRVSIIWKCRPLTEDEFAPAIKENFYSPKKFYFDLSYKQVVRLYELFNDRRVEHPNHSYTKNESLGIQYLSKREPDKRSSSPNAPHSDDKSCLLIPDISAIVERYSSHTSKHTVLPPGGEVQPNMALPLGIENFRPQIAFTHNHHDQTKFPCQGEHLQAASITTRKHQLAGSQLLPPYDDNPQKVLSSGRIIQGPAEGAKFDANQSYSLSHGFTHNSLSSGHVAQNPTYGDSTPYTLPVPALSLENSQGNADYQEDCDICMRQRYLSAHDKMYAYEHQRLSEGKALPSAELSQQGITAYTDIAKFRGTTTSTVDQWKDDGSADYISLSDCGINFDNPSDSSDLENGIQQHKKHVIGADSNTKVPQSNVFSRISLSPQPPSEEVTGPTLSQLVSSLSRKTKQWSGVNPAQDRVSCMMREQEDVFYSRFEINLPTQLEFEAGESTESQPPFLNFKRRSKAQNVDTNLGKEPSGKPKRRKLVRPSFGENNASSSANSLHERKHVEVGHFDIDLNKPATVDSDPIEKDNSIEVCPGVLNMTKTEKLFEVDTNKTDGSKLMDEIISELNPMDESKLRTILISCKQLANGKISSVKSTNFEEARSSIYGEL